jgi:hypothetical protein
LNSANIGCHEIDINHMTEPIPPSAASAVRPADAGSAAHSAWLTGVTSREQVQQDVVHVLLALVNQLRFSVLRSNGRGDAALWSLLTGNPVGTARLESGDGTDVTPPGGSSRYAYPDNTPDDLDLTFTDVADTALAEEMLRLYDYGVLGLLDVSAPTLDDGEGGAAWASRAL